MRRTRSACSGARACPDCGCRSVLSAPVFLLMERHHSKKFANEHATINMSLTKSIIMPTSRHRNDREHAETSSVTCAQACARECDATYRDSTFGDMKLSSRLIGLSLSSLHSCSGWASRQPCDDAQGLEFRRQLPDPRCGARGARGARPCGPDAPPVKSLALLLASCKLEKWGNA
jgi:hypothetical protein